MMSSKRITLITVKYDIIKTYNVPEIGVNVFLLDAFDYMAETFISVKNIYT